MLGEFTYGGKTYCIKDELEHNYTPDEVVSFSNLEKIHEFFGAAVNDSGAWTVIMSIAKWKYPGICRPPTRCPEPTDEEYFNALCLQIFNGKLTLIEESHKSNPYPKLQDVRLRQCCTDTIQEINDDIIRGDVLSAVHIALPFFNAFFYPPGYSEWASLTSTVSSIAHEDWDDFAKNILLVPTMTRRIVYKIAEEHAIYHEFKNDYKLKMFWQGVVNAFK